jgi:hypothetical protein
MKEPEEQKVIAGKPHQEQVNTDISAPQGIRVYERPARPSVLTILLILLLIVILAAVLFFQFFQ